MRLLVTISFAFLALAGHAQKIPLASAERMEERILALSQFGLNPGGGVSRVAYSEADKNARKYIMDLMRAAKLEVSVDAAGNIIGKRSGQNNTLPVIAFGSHIDSVPGGGNYDGDVGSLGAIECIEILNKSKIITQHPLEVIIFQNEEGGLIGSEAICGILPAASLSLFSLSGKTIRQGIIDLGGDPEKIAEAARKKGYFKAFLELHIEQGGMLDRANQKIGIVEGIVGINQWSVTVTGKANHAGTTPMDQRQDAVVAAAQLVVVINQVASTTAGRQVATVGRINALPGAPNVVPGRVDMSLEIRDLSHEKIVSLFESIRVKGEQIAKLTGTAIEYALISENLPAMTNKQIQDLIAITAKELGFSAVHMPSGAGHDTQDMATLAPVGMIFVPSKNGISHAPDEFTSPQDMANGASVLTQTILKIDKMKIP